MHVWYEQGQLSSWLESRIAGNTFTEDGALKRGCSWSQGECLWNFGVQMQITGCACLLQVAEREQNLCVRLCNQMHLVGKLGHADKSQEMPPPKPWQDFEGQIQALCWFSYGVHGFWDVHHFPKDREGSLCSVPTPGQKLCQKGRAVSSSMFFLAASFLHATMTSPLLSVNTYV